MADELVPDETVKRPPGGPTPPAPPTPADDDGVDPSDPGPPILVRFNEQVIGDLGHPRVDARLVSAILIRQGRFATWLHDQGIDLRDLQRAFPDATWPKN